MGLAEYGMDKSQPGTKGKITLSKRFNSVKKNAMHDFIKLREQGLICENTFKDKTVFFCVIDVFT